MHRFVNYFDEKLGKITRKLLPASFQLFGNFDGFIVAMILYTYSQIIVAMNFFPLEKWVRNHEYLRHVIHYFFSSCKSLQLTVITSPIGKCIFLKSRTP